MGIMKVGIEGRILDYVNFDHVTHVVVKPVALYASNEINIPGIGKLDLEHGTELHDPDVDGIVFEAVIRYDDGTATVVANGKYEDCVDTVESLIKVATGYRWEQNGAKK